MCHLLELVVLVAWAILTLDGIELSYQKNMVFLIKIGNTDKLAVREGKSLSLLKYSKGPSYYYQDPENLEKRKFN